MKTVVFDILVVTMLSVPTWGQSFRSVSAGGSVPVADSSALPSLGEGRILTLKAEQLIADLAAAQRRHEAVIRDGIDDANHRGRTGIESTLRRLLKEGTASEKANYVNSTNKVYRLPERLQIREDNAPFQLAFDRGTECRPHRCLSYGPMETCSDRTICRVVCQAASGAVGGAIGGAVGGAIGGVAAGEVCTQVCQTLPECRIINACLEYEYRGIC